MSKADLLGASSSFDNASRRSARRRMIDAATGVPSATPVDLQHAVSAAIDEVAHNPDNPRTSLGDVRETAASLSERGQIQPITVMTCAAYLRANPGRHGEIDPAAQYIAIDGNRRLAAAREAGLPTVKIYVSDDLAATSGEVLESALVANIHRQDLTPLEEAQALQSLLDVHGTQTKVAQRLGKSQGWVSQRLSLLSLAPELQEDLKAGRRTVEHLRGLGRKDSGSQRKEADARASRDGQADGAGEDAAKERGIDKGVTVVGTAHSSTLPEQRDVERAPLAGAPGHTAARPPRTAVLDNDLAALATCLRAAYTPEELAELIRLLTAADD
ncbi:ParB/RepB/Spo0J family partition protein [Wenjunlia tyrosinilytica]|uniref:Plasmid partitioning protein n=1 Tax=Wenjunlia tyrosinilytica TaxID=1544741 RepID=A0A918E0A7_9ACTN|nr:ParB/RepB/Spo0J family partition protein [Wenjunlia tyrosinilytica]GGO97985.1 plasmid partitioning protein [Wenjunlia tyrosinilytica]